MLAELEAFLAHLEAQLDSPTFERVLNSSRWNARQV